MMYLVRNSKLKGFTLIELLVVISLIGILAALALVSYTGTQKQARDAQRKSDLKQYQNSLELFANKNNGLYPSYDTNPTSLCSVLGLGSNCPDDPRASESDQDSYRYQSDGSGTGNPEATEYVLWAELENTDGYWTLCSNGKVRAITTGIPPTGGACPL